MPWHQPRIREANGETVILLHGLWRSIWAMDPMAKFLNQQGYRTINIPYPSFRKPIEDIVTQISSIIDQHGGQSPIHFVTHSLGGIITRQLLAEMTPENTGKVVMLAPPNQGSEIIDWLEGCPPLRKTLGPAGAKIGTTTLDAPYLPEHIDSAVIMGRRSSLPFFRHMLERENDGIVSVERGKTPGINEFHVIDSDHTFIVTEPQVMQMTHEFLKNGPTR